MRRVTIQRSSILIGPLQMLFMFLGFGVVQAGIFLLKDDQFNLLLMSYCFIGMSIVPMMMIVGAYRRFHKTRPNLLCSHKSVEYIPDGKDAIKHFSDQDDAQ